MTGSLPENLREAKEAGWDPTTEWCVSCPECAFTFDAFHTDTDGGYSCPVCAEVALRARLEQLERVEEQLQARLGAALAMMSREQHAALERHIRDNGLVKADGSPLAGVQETEREQDPSGEARSGVATNRGQEVTAEGRKGKPDPVAPDVSPDGTSEAASATRGSASHSSVSSGASPNTETEREERERFWGDRYEEAAVLAPTDWRFVPPGDEVCDEPKDACRCMKRKGHDGDHRCSHGFWRAVSVPNTETEQDGNDLGGDQGSPSAEVEEL